MTTYTKFVADIGGTHARFALVEPENSSGRATLAEVKVFKCADFSSPAETVIAYRQFLGEPCLLSVALQPQVRSTTVK